MHSWIGLLLAAAEGGEHGGGGGTVTDVNFATVIWAWVAFLVTLWALSKIAWPMLAAKMEEREKRIREGLEKAEEAEKHAQELMERQEGVLQQAREEAQKLLAESRGTAENIKKEAISAAEREIADQRERAKKEIDVERKRALGELRSVAVDLSLAAAGRVLERSLTEEDHRRLAAEVIDEVESLKN